MHYTSKEVYKYISKHTSDSIIERKKCRISGQDFPIYQSDLDFYEKISPKFEVSPDYAKQFLEENKDIAENFEYKDGTLKCKIPTPTLCPEERQRRRLAFRNERKLYKRKCDFSGKEIISIYSPDSGASHGAGKTYKVYDQSIWWSDKWDALEHRIDIDMKKSFAEQFDNLIRTVPLNNLYIKNSENSEYNFGLTDSKNCYLCVSTAYVENVFYSTLTGWLKDCCDSHRLLYSENCYQCIDCERCYNCKYLIDCTHCNNCIYCSKIHRKQYCIFNKQVSKKEYERFLQTGITEENEQKRKKLINEEIKSNLNQNSENCHGSLIRNSSNCSFVSDVVDCHNSKYLFISGLNIDNIYDCSGGDVFQSSLCYECGLIPMNNKLISCRSCRESHNLTFYFECFSCKNCFGCVGLRNKEYCIFNKQYTKEEYNQLVPKIIAQMMRVPPLDPLLTGGAEASRDFGSSQEGQKGKVPPCEGGHPNEVREGGKQRGEFFDPQLSPFGYNETVAMEYYPLTKEEALKLGYNRSEYEAPFPKVEKFVQGKKLRTASCKLIHEQKPELLEKILNYAVVCEVSGRPFRIIKQEIDFYIKHDLPLPRKHPDIRHQERMNKRPGRTLYLRTCDKYGEEMLSVYEDTQNVIPAKAGIQETSRDSGSSQEGQRDVTQSLPRRQTGLPDGQTGEAKHPKIDTMDSSAKASEGQKIYCEKCYQKEIYG